MPEYLSEKDERKLAYYFKRYSKSLEKTVQERLGKKFHADGVPVPFVYLCPLCLINKVSYADDTIRQDADFTLDHFPPESVGGKRDVYVCKSCNDIAGHDFDYGIKEWLQYQSFGRGVPNAKIPAIIKLKDVKGNYKGTIELDETKSWKLDNFEKYPLFAKRMTEMLAGNPLEQSFKFDEPSLQIVSRAVIKAAYLYCFSVWGYDFAYTATGHRLRQILWGKEEHPLSNAGIFYHMDNVYPPDGISMVYKPAVLQTFLVSFKIADKATGYQCGVSVLIPGGYNEWESILNYQSIIKTQDNFQNALIRVPEDCLSDENIFPFTSFWEHRNDIRIFGDSDLRV